MSAYFSSSGPPLDDVARRTLDVVPQILWVSDANGRIVYLNTLAREFSGLNETPDQPPAWGELVHPDDLAGVCQAWSEAIERRGSFRCEMRLVGGTGEARWFAVTGAPWSPDSNHSTHNPQSSAPSADADSRQSAGSFSTTPYWLGVATDVQAQRDAIAAAELAEQRYRSLKSATPAFVWDALESPAAAPAGGSPSDPSHSPRLESEFDSFAAADWQARVHPEDRPRLLAAWHAAADEGRPFECEYRFRGPDGRWRHVVGRAAPVVHDGQPISEWVGTVVDVTDQRESRERLKQRDFLEAVLETVDDGIVACDERGERVVFNRQARQMHAGVTDVGAPEEWTARASLYRPDGKTPLPMEEIPLYRALQGEVVHDVEMVIAPPGRPPHTVLASGRRLVGPEGEKLGAVAVMRDVTETRRLENHLRQVQKMEAVGRLASGVAHDFNNLLTIINGYSDLLLSTLSPDHPGCDSAEAIRDAAERASDLTGQLLAFSRESVLAPRELDLNRAILGLEKMLRRLLGDDVTLTLALTATIGRVKVDPTHLTQMLMNLVVNARDAMPQGGKLTLETHPVTFAEDGPIGVGPVGSGALAPGRYVMIAVSDTGQGIPDELRSRIFEPFFTTKGLGCGTGLGLSTVYGIVKQSGGHIDVYSEVGHGTTFKIYLPAPDASLDGTQLLRDESTAFDSIQLGAECRETVLLVEDDPGVRRLTRRALEALGYRVLEAEDGEEALTVFERSGVTIDLLLTDVVMPRMNGRALAEALASRRPGTKVLYISGYPDEAAVLHDVIRAGSPFLRKPYSSQSLAQKLREVLDASSPGGSSIASGSSLSTGWAALAARPNAGEAPK